MFILYDLIFIVFALIYLPFMLIRKKWHKGFFSRRGRFTDSERSILKNGKNIWIHAVSVGEVLTIVDLVKKLKETFPDHKIVCTTVTKTGHQIALSKLKDYACILFAPFDCSWIVKKYIRAIHPKIYIATETEIWPNLYTFLYRNHVPIIQINGRISDKGFQGYRKVVFLTRKILKCVEVFCVQTEEDKARLIHLGANPKKIYVLGNLKFDNLPRLTHFELHDFGFSNDDELLIGGSTHPGEEEILIEIYKKLSDEFTKLRLIICPRHVERAYEIIKLIEDKGFGAVKFSQMKKRKGRSKEIVVVDTIGHLRTLYSIAKIVFIGKTLKVGGGQNMIEPAFFGKPTFVGPFTENFKQIVSVFLKENALVQVQNEEELYAQMRSVLKDPQRLDEIGTSARNIVNKYQGATTKTIEAISDLISIQQQVINP